MLQNLSARACPSRLLLRYVAIAFFIAFCCINYLLWQDSKMWEWAQSNIPVAFFSTHPITKLMTDARKQHDRVLLSQRTYDVGATAARYRSLRGRHPPPGFDKWVEAALAADAIIVEEYFDRIYKDIGPFWGLEAETLAKRAAASEFVVRVRDGNVTMPGLDESRVEWQQNWAQLVEEFAEHLPDVDMPINMMDEPRIAVPQDTIHSYVQKDLRSRNVLPVDEVTTSYTGLKKIDESNAERYEPKWSGNDNMYWDLVAGACGPSTPAHGVPAITDFAPAAAVPDKWQPDYSFRGFVKNWTAAIDPCNQPHVRQLHGSFVEPVSISSTDELIPLFGGCKLAMNNEIILPGAMYLSDSERYSGGDTHGPDWERKRNGVVWRGVDSGGRARESNWHHLQRHRLVQMLNGTTVSQMEESGERNPSFDLPPKNIYPSQVRARHELGFWLTGFADAGFIDICSGSPDCGFLSPYMKKVAKVPMKEQYEYKFLPDIDGNSYSARFRGFLLSTSLPLKASIYTEWHDDRLTPWVHFVPLDNTMQDLYPALEYFADGSGPGDKAARYIAEEGKTWAEKVLRREDMRLYVWRLLLEWARVCDEKRDTLGFIGDVAHES